MYKYLILLFVHLVSGTYKTEPRISKVTHEERYLTTSDVKIKVQVFTLKFNVSSEFNRWYFQVCFILNVEKLSIWSLFSNLLYRIL